MAEKLPLIHEVKSKTSSWIIIGIVLAISAAAQSNQAKPELWQEMQEAVLKTKDIGKVQDLLDRGIDINAPIGCGTFNALDGAISTENVEMLRFLLAHGAKPRGRELANAAFVSGYQPALEMVKLLYAAGVDPNICGWDGPALTNAVQQKNVELVKFLLSTHRIKLDETDMSGYTALMLAARDGLSDVVDLLIAAGADPKFRNERGETAENLAERQIQKRQAIISKLEAPAK